MYEVDKIACLPYKVRCTVDKIALPSFKVKIRNKVDKQYLPYMIIYEVDKIARLPYKVRYKVDKIAISSF